MMLNFVIWFLLLVLNGW